MSETSIRSPSNYTITPLGGSNIFIGQYDNVLQYSTAIITCIGSTNMELTLFQTVDKKTIKESTYAIVANVQKEIVLDLKYPFIKSTLRNQNVGAQTYLNFEILYREVSVSAAQSVASAVNISDTNGNPITSSSGKLQVQDSIAELSLTSIDAKITNSRGAEILWATPSTGAGGFSAPADLTEVSPTTLTFYGNSNLATVFTVQFSNDNITWYSSQSTYTLTTGGDWGFSIQASPFYVRLTSSVNVSCNAILNYS